MTEHKKTKRVILVGIGGATCSGKTTLAKHLRRILPDSVIIHQDDFAPPQELVPMHPIYNVQDWDAPKGAIDWPRLVKFLRRVKETGEIPPDHRSHDHLNEQKEVKLDDKVFARWRDTFEQAKRERQADGDDQIVWGLVDGFLLYWHPDVRNELDTRVFLRVPHDILKQRRHERHGYHTAVQSDPEGSLWRDPPEYWEQIVWPAYVEAHGGMFVGNDLERGPAEDHLQIHLIEAEPSAISISEMVWQCCDLLAKY